MSLAALLLALQSPAAQSSVPRARGWEDFPVFVWRETYAGKPLPEELAEPFGGVILMRGEDSDWARARGLAYLVWNVAGRDALHLDADEAWNARVEKWIETHDEALLVREPCLNDPKTLASLHDTLAATRAKHGEHPGLAFVLGDEVSLTPNGDPFDLCRCGFCEAKWKEYAEARSLPERAPLTDEVLADLRANEFARLGAWLARRRFDQDRMLEVLHELSASADMSPSWSIGGAYAGLLGCKGQTAFGGVALERVVDCLGLIECYPLDSAREMAATAPGLWRHGLHFSSGPDPGPLARTATLFLRDGDPAELAWSVYDAWLHGASGLVLWSDTELARLSSEARTRLVEAVTTVRSPTLLQDDGQHTPLWFAPHAGSIAVVRDADSTALSFLRDALGDGATWPRRRAGYQLEHGRLERKVETWMRLIEDCQIEPGAIALSSVCASCSTGGLAVLVLPELLVLGDDDVARLAAFVAGGGWIVVDGTLGWVDRDGRPRDDAATLRARLAGEHPERVVDAQKGLDDYLAARLDGERGAVQRRFLLDLPPVKRTREFPSAQARPLFTGEAARVAWLIRSSELGPSAPGYLLLPNHESAPDRRRLLRDLPLDGIRAPEGYTLEWILPPDGKLLRAGDVARLRFSPGAQRSAR